ncbi:helix-hairpin-helix domain-containing protein [Clostridium sp. FP2]|uniref:helix-hairpin-helix domain-containing protein n=1 Tax=Clostridium TaxID=1485 RepID=UPI0013E94864|nr:MULTISPECIES: helix-hairpin-helix domain-containing protein [Clostridium]MBW9155074.1 helix-hairpin-helix domain-containing protein [Clostridium tagluense]MBZ9624686.1 helix-hairpin-helix domain-containing protein [Clostridium sp. FP2]WLC64520.1 helix-hairpin-helix domain-containing protein [Clostridium tagluense]
MKNKEKIIGSIIILCISIVFIIVGYTMSGPKESIKDTDYKDIFVETDKASEKKDANKSVTKSNTAIKSNIALQSNAAVQSNTVEDSNIKVDIKGAVACPGVYEIKKESRVNDIVKLAGGVTLDADLYATNLSQKLKDEDCIVIYKKGEADKLQKSQSKSSDSMVSSSKVAKDIVNINTANKEELKTLTGIGDTKADGIIKYREENGGFKSVEELRKVDGIGEKTLSKFIDKVDIK